MDPREWQLIGELLELTRDWNRFELHDKAEEIKVREIGTELEKLGGYDLLYYAYRTARVANQAASDIQYIWDGIGAWRW